MTLKNKIELRDITTLILGDWSKDGHSLSDTIHIASNINNKEIEKAYKKATKKLGFDFIDDVCRDYEDDLCPKDILNILIKYKFSINDLYIDPKFTGDLENATEVFTNKDSDGLHLRKDSFLYIYLFIIKLGNKNFKYEILEEELNPSIHIGGYGLYL